MNQYVEMAFKIFSWVGIVESAVFVAGIIYAIVLWVRGILPAIFRLGNGLAKRKIAIFAKGDNLNSLRGLLNDSGLFRKNNIIEVTNNGDFGKAEEASVYLVFWPDWTDNLSGIVGMKPDKCALVVYAPYDKGRIPDDQMKNIDGKRHSAVTNFRGRLLNDIVTAMITTSYGK